MCDRSHLHLLTMPRKKKYKAGRSLDNNYIERLREYYIILATLNQGIDVDADPTVIDRLVEMGLIKEERDEFFQEMLSLTRKGQETISQMEMILREEARKEDGAKRRRRKQYESDIPDCDDLVFSSSSSVERAIEIGGALGGLIGSFFD